MELYNILMKLKPFKEIFLKKPYVPFSEVVRNVIVEDKRKAYFKKLRETEFGEDC